MNQWYYAANGAQQGPVAIDQLVEWARAGQLGPDASVWRDGMPQWAPAGQVPELATAFGGDAGQAATAQQPGYPAAAAHSPLQYEAPGQEGLTVSPRAIEMLRQTRPWVLLFAILLFIVVGLIVLVSLIQLVGAIGLASSDSQVGGSVAGLVLVATILTLAVSLLYFFPALYLGRYASRIGALVRFRRQADFEAALEAQKSYWKFFGILFLVAIGLYVLAAVVVVVGVGMAASGQ